MDATGSPEIAVVGPWQLEQTGVCSDILPGVLVRELIRLLEQDGWYLARTRGSHRQFRHPSKPGTVTVAGKRGADIPAGTLSSALKQAGLQEKR